MNSTSSLPFLLSAALFANAASAQSTPACPALPPEAATDLRWTTLQTDSALLCRALDSGGQEAFAVTVARKSPFKPNGSLREESGQMQGQNFWWYRTEIAGRPNELVRETLVKLDRDRVVHVFIRTSDKATLGRYQRIVQGLQFEPAAVAKR
jgi:hypothetical protein